MEYMLAKVVWVHLKDKSCSGKCKIFWEGHKIWKKSPIFFGTSKQCWIFFLIFVALSKCLNFIRHSLNWQTLYERNKKIWINTYVFLVLFWCPELTEFPNEIIDFWSQCIKSKQWRWKPFSSHAQIVQQSTDTLFFVPFIMEFPTFKFL